MKLSELFNELDSGRRLKDICVQSGINVRTVQKRLNKLGYTWNQLDKLWEWKRIDEQPLDYEIIEVNLNSHTDEQSMSIRHTNANLYLGVSMDKDTEFIKNNTDESVNHSSSEVESGVKEIASTSTIEATRENNIHTEDEPHMNNDSPEVSVNLYKELQAITKLLQKQTSQQHMTRKVKFGELFEKICNLDRGEKTRKTIVINEKIGDRLDYFADKTNMDKSDIMHVALLDFFEKYNLADK
jgi:hypothetical protein